MLLGAVLAGCSGAEGLAPAGDGAPVDSGSGAPERPAGAGPTGTLVVGVQGQLWRRIRAVLRVDGAVVRREDRDDVAMGPLELAFAELPDGSDVELTFEPELEPGASGRLLARSTIRAGKRLLLRLSTAGCVSVGDYQAPDCPEGQTCNSGVCRPAYVPPELLEEYSPTWASFSYCKPEAHGAPEVILGTGFDAFAPIRDHGTLPAYPGHQGGHHVWVSVRQRNLLPAGVLALSGEVPELGLTIPETSAVEWFADDPTVGYCEVIGTYLQLDREVDIAEIYGKELVLTAEVRDRDGDEARDQRRVTVVSLPP